MRRINRWFASNDKRWFYLLALLGGLEAANLEWLSTMPYSISAVVTLLLIGVICIYMANFYTYLKEKQKGLLKRQHDTFIENIVEVQRTLTATEERLSNQLNQQNKDLIDKIQAGTQLVNQTIHEVREQVNEKVEVVEQHLLSDLNDSKEQQLNEIRDRTGVLKEALTTRHDDTLKHLNISKREIVGTLEGRSEHLSEQLVKTNEETINHLHNQEKVLLAALGDGHNRVDHLFKKQESQNEALVGNVIDKVAAFELATIRLTNSNQDQLSQEVTASKEVLEAKLIEIIHDIQIFKATLLEKASHLEKETAKTVQTESQQIVALLNAKTESLADTINEAKTLHQTSTEGLFKQVTQSEQATIMAVQSEKRELQSALGTVKEVLDQSFSDMKQQQNHASETVLSSVNQSDEQIIHALNGSVEQIENELKSHHQFLLEGTRQELTSLSSIVQDTAQQTNEFIESLISEKTDLVGTTVENRFHQLKEYAFTVQDTLKTSLEDRLNRLSDHIDKSEKGQADRQNQLKDSFIEGVSSINEHMDVNTQATLSHFDEKLETNLEKNEACFTLGLSETNRIINQSLGGTENRLSKLFREGQDQQKDMQQFINQTLKRGSEQSDNVHNQIHELKSTVSKLQKEIIQHVSNQFSEIKTEQQGEKESLLNFGKRFERISEQMSQVQKTVDQETHNLDSQVDLLRSQVNRLEKSSASSKDKLSDLINKAQEQDRRFVTDSQLLREQQDHFSQNVDRLTVQYQTIYSLMKLLNSSLEERVLNQQSSSGRSAAKELKKDKNRIEKIQDDENGILIVNKYELDVLKNSEMFQSGSKMYTADFDEKGQLLISRNYDKTGKVLTEMTYFPNGNVKERKEHFKQNGKWGTKRTAFDQTGKKVRG